MFRNPLSFLLGPQLDDETKAKIKQYKEKQSELIDEMRKMQRAIRDDAYNQMKKREDAVEREMDDLYEHARNIISIRHAEDYRYFVSTILANMVENYASQSPLLPSSLPPRSILKLYMSGCGWCKHFVNPLSSISDFFLPGSLLTLEYNLAQSDPYLKTVVDQLEDVGWGGGVPAWFLMEPDVTGAVTFKLLNIPSWPSLVERENKDPERARIRLATLLKEQLVVEKMAETVSQIAAQEHLGQAKAALASAERYGKSFKQERKALRRLLAAENADPVVAKMQQFMRTYRDPTGRTYKDPLDLDDESLAIIMMDPAFRIPRYGSLYRSDITDYYLGLNESAKKATKVETAAPAAAAPAATSPAAAATAPSTFPMDL